MVSNVSPVNFSSVNPQKRGASAASGEHRSSGAKVYTAGALAGGVLGTGAGYLTGKVMGDSFIKSKDLEGKLSKLCEELEKNNETLKNLNARNAGLEKSYYKSAEEYFSRMIKLVEPKRQEITELMISKVYVNLLIFSPFGFSDFSLKDYFQGNLDLDHERRRYTETNQADVRFY